MRRYAALDGLRGLAALSVFSLHGMIQMGWADQPAEPWLLNAPPLRVLWGGDEAVVLFFVLSGFVLALPFVKGVVPGYGRFALKRFARLYPTFLLAIVLSALLAAVLPLNTVTGPLDSPGAVLANFLPMVTPMKARPVDVAIWSLIHEMRISLIFPLLVWLLTRAGWRFPVVAGLVGVGTLVGGFADRSDLLRTPMYVGDFALGAWLAYHRVAVIAWYQDLSGRRRLGMAVVGLALYALWVQGVSDAVWHLPVLAGAAWLVVVAQAEPAAQRVLGWRPVAAVGKASYSLYLLHLLVLMPLLVWFGRGLPVIALAWVIVAPVTYLAYRFVECPSMRLSRYLGESHRTKSGPVLAVAIAD